MTAEPRIRTEAEKTILDTFDRVGGGLPGGKLVTARRATAFDLFRKTGLPHRRIEEWKYTDLRVLMRKAMPPAERPSDEAVRAVLAALPDPLAGLDRYRLVIADGYFIAAVSDGKALAAIDVAVASTGELLGKDAEAVFDVPAIADGDIALALNSAFAVDGVVVGIPDDAMLGKPLEILHLSTMAGQAATSRSRVQIGARATAKVIETYRGPNGADYQVSAATGIEAGDGAIVVYVRLQAEGDSAIHVGTTMLNLGSGTAFDHLTMTAGAAVSRAQMFLTTGGQRTRASINGVGMLGGKQHGDVTLLIDHVVPGATTRVLFKTVIDDEARGVFQGKIIVEPDAQKTDAKMMSQALLISETAEFDSKPELEIFADDVQCGHGSTAGQIDDTQLFYLMARGIPRAQAERLLIEAFLDSAIDALGDETIGTALKRTVRAWLERREAA
jgi:Fe-S cluster assembly protein SufD